MSKFDIDDVIMADNSYVFPSLSDNMVTVRIFTIENGRVDVEISSYQMARIIHNASRIDSVARHIDFRPTV